MYNPNIYSECSFKSLQAHSNGVIRENVKSLCIAIVGKKNGIDVIVYSQQKWNKKGLRLKIMRFIFFVVHKKESICQNTSLLLSNLLYVFVERRGQSKRGLLRRARKMVIAFYRSLYLCVQEASPGASRYVLQYFRDVFDPACDWYIPCWIRWIEIATFCKSNSRIWFKRWNLR